MKHEDIDVFSDFDADFMNFHVIQLFNEKKKKRNKHFLRSTTNKQNLVGVPASFIFSIHQKLFSILLDISIQNGADTEKIRRTHTQYTEYER